MIKEKVIVKGLRAGRKACINVFELSVKFKI